jgi:uncharacterized protein involved in type VI secretion and phage assembly
MNYQNNFEGIPAEAKIPDYTNPNAFPPCEVQSAIVKDNNDPDKLGRVRVNFYWQEDNLMSPWLRIVNTYSGAEAGFYFIPEVDDEVMVDFEGGNAEKPFVIGSLHHGKNKPAPYWPDKNNSFKGILSKSKLKIEFDDQKKITTIETPGGNKAVLSDDEKSILLQDQNQNKIELTTGGIVLDSPKDIKITSKSKIIIDSSGGIDISSTSAKGNATAELSSSGNTTVKGSMVMIN